jgi:hypothetical protein
MFALVLTVSLTIGGVTLWRMDRERQALLDLPPEVRVRVYHGALATLAEMCPAPRTSPVLSERCRLQAEFLAQFPECDEACLRLVRANSPQPTR